MTDIEKYNKLFEDYQQKCNKDIENFKDYCNTINPGSISPKSVLSVEITASQKICKIKDIANVSESRGCIEIRPYEKSNLKYIESALSKLDLGTAVVVDNIIQLKPPVDTKESRQKMLKNFNISVENFKQCIKKARQDIMNILKPFQKSNEDFFKKEVKKIDKNNDTYNDKIDMYKKNVEKVLS